MNQITTPRRFNFDFLSIYKYFNLQIFGCSLYFDSHQSQKNKINAQKKCFLIHSYFFYLLTSNSKHICKYIETSEISSTNKKVNQYDL